MEFREPTIADCDQIEAYRQAFEKNQEVIHGGAGLVESPTAKDWLEGLADFKTAETVPEGFVPARTYLAIQDQKVVGLLNLRLTLNAYLRQIGGHIG